jgi:hypothetical protein
MWDTARASASAAAVEVAVTAPFYTTEGVPSQSGESPADRGPGRSRDYRRGQ